jgi:hypothetical protein
MARPLTQGDIEALLREAAEVTPAPMLADDPRLKNYAAQFATMLLFTSHRGESSK